MILASWHSVTATQPGGAAPYRLDVFPLRYSTPESS